MVIAAVLNTTITGTATVTAIMIGIDATTKETTIETETAESIGSNKRTGKAVHRVWIDGRLSHYQQQDCGAAPTS